MLRNLPADVRSARLLKVVQAMVLSHGQLPASTRKLLVDRARAIRLLIEANQDSLAITEVVGLKTLSHSLRTEVDPEYIKALQDCAEDLRRALRRQP